MLWIYFDSQGVAKCKVNVGNKIRQGDAVPLFIYLEGKNEGTNNWKVTNVDYVKPGSATLETAIAGTDYGLTEETFSLGNPSEANFYFRNGESYKGYEISLPSDATSFVGNGGHLVVHVTLSLDDDQKRMETISQYVEPTYGNKAIGITHEEYAKLVDLYKNYYAIIEKGQGANAGEQVGTPDTIDFTNVNGKSGLTGEIPAGGIGKNSMSLGGSSSAQGASSIAEGSMTVAMGDNSHAEGYGSASLLDCSHAEGYCTVTQGLGSHSEGISTVANGIASHAEGGKTAASDYAHAEGYVTNASGTCSHAGGRDSSATMTASFSHGLGTKATAEGQAVFGAFNAEDKNAIFIVGNGNDKSETAVRQNAFEVMLDGRAKVQADPSEYNDVVNLQYADMKYQEQYAATNIRGYLNYSDAVKDLSNLNDNQIVIAPSSSESIGINGFELHYVYNNNDGEKQLRVGRLGAEALKNTFVYTGYKQGTKQMVGTGLFSEYRDNDANRVSFGTMPSANKLGFYVDVLDASGNYSGAISLGAKTYKFAYDSAVDVFSSDGNTTAIKSPMGNASVELTNADSKVYGTNVYIGTKEAETTYSSAGVLNLMNAIKLQGNARLTIDAWGDTQIKGGYWYFHTLVYFDQPVHYDIAPEGDDWLANKSYVDKTAEAQAKAVQTDLQAKIDAINASQNFVATYATEKDLPSSPSSGVEEGDCALVLKDGDNLNQSTVYKWTGSKWEFVGELGDYYTKAYINAEFAKTNGNVAYYRSQADSYAKKVDDYANATDDKIAELGKVVDTAKDAYLASTPTFVETSSSTEESDVTPTLVGLFAETGSSTTISE